MKLVLIGIQGAGKSTQGNLLSRQLKIPYLSTGHIFREIAKEDIPEQKIWADCIRCKLFPICNEIAMVIDI